MPDKTEKLTEGGEAAEVWHALQDTGDARTPRTGLPVSLKFVDDKLTTIGQ